MLTCHRPAGHAPATLIDRTGAGAGTPRPLRWRPRMKPARRPQRPEFSSGPCAKRPGWSLSALSGALLGRSHRAQVGKDRLQAVIERSRALVALLDGCKLALVRVSVN